MELLNVYAKRETTTDSLVKYNTKKKDIVFYRDSNCTEVFCRMPWHSSNKPNKNSKTIMLNCYKWAIVWID